MADAAAALRHTTSYRVVGQLDDNLTVSVTVTPTGAKGTVTSHGVSWDMVALDGRLWFRGATLWRATAAAQARRFGNSWVLVRDQSAGYGWAVPLTQLSQRIPTFFFAPKPGLANHGRRVVDGREVVHLTNGDDAHDVLATGTPYPIDWLEPDEPGPDGQPCGVTLSNFDAPVTVTAPKTSLVF